MKKESSLSHEMVQYWIHPALFMMALGAVLAVAGKLAADHFGLVQGPFIWTLIAGVTLGLVSSLIASVLMGAFVAMLRGRHE